MTYVVLIGLALAGLACIYNLAEPPEDRRERLAREERDYRYYRFTVEVPMSIDAWKEWRKP